MATAKRKIYFIVQEFPVAIAGINSNETFESEEKAIARAKRYAIETAKTQYVVCAVAKIEPASSVSKL